jgi:hypothetical protein
MRSQTWRWRQEPRLLLSLTVGYCQFPSSTDLPKSPALCCAKQANRWLAGESARRQTLPKVDGNAAGPGRRHPPFSPSRPGVGLDVAECPLQIHARPCTKRSAGVHAVQIRGLPSLPTTCLTGIELRWRFVPFSGAAPHGSSGAHETFCLGLPRPASRASATDRAPRHSGRPLVVSGCGRSCTGVNRWRCFEQLGAQTKHEGLT